MLHVPNQVINSRYLSVGIKQFTLKSLQLISTSENDQRITDQARTNDSYWKEERLARNLKYLKENYIELIHSTPHVACLDVI